MTRVWLYGDFTLWLRLPLGRWVAFAAILCRRAAVAASSGEGSEGGEESGLSDEEIAFYDALAENHSARDLMGEPALRVIAHELVNSIRDNVTVDWAHRDAARARMRVLV